MSKHWLGLLLLVVWIDSNGVAHAAFNMTEMPDPITIGTAPIGLSGTASGTLSGSHSSPATSEQDQVSCQDGRCCTATFSEFLCAPKRVIRQLDKTPQIVIKRRDADDLVLMNAARADEDSGGVEIVAHVLAKALSKVPSEIFSRALEERLPWARFCRLRRATGSRANSW